MKCPKCHYLGFDTGDRCRNCGYDFSLLSVPSSTSLPSTSPPSASPRADVRAAGDVALHREPAAAADRLADVPIDPFAVPRPELADAGLQSRLPDNGLQTRPGDAGFQPWSRSAVPAPADTTATRSAGALPLFVDAADDRPLIKFPSAPRAPLSVRKTPDAPRVKPAAPPRRRTVPDDDARLVFPEEPAPAETVPMPPAPRRPQRTLAPDAVAPCTAGARLGAALIDVGMLLAVDLLVLYFTLRMAALPMEEWRLLPLAPLLAFLLLVKLEYYWAFTAIGGQTIGKMAMRIRVIADEGVDVDPTLALRRTVLASTTLLTFGAAFLPALVRHDRRAVHDQIAHTRVVALPAA
jgi:uncharacterized RDD family membrane protein YckC